MSPEFKAGDILPGGMYRLRDPVELGQEPTDELTRQRYKNMGKVPVGNESVVPCDEDGEVLEHHPLIIFPGNRRTGGDPNDTAA